MKKLTKLSAIVLTAVISLAIWTSCQKEVSGVNGRKLLNDESKKAVTAWLDNQEHRVSNEKKTRLQSLRSNMMLDKAFEEKVDGGDGFIIVPLDKDFRTINNTGKNVTNTLALRLDESGKIIRGNIVQALSSNEEGIRMLPGTCSGILSDGNFEVSGTFTVLTIYDRFLYTNEYENGRKVSASFLQSMDNGDAWNNRTETQCIDWYLITIVYYLDGTTDTWEEYVGSTCGDCLLSAPDVKKATLCDEYGGGGNESCCVSSLDDIQIVSNSVSESVSVNCGLERVDPVSGLLTKTCAFRWNFCTNTLLFYTWKYLSFETAQLELENGVWKFKSINHSGMGTDGTIPPCVDAVCQIGSSIGSISSNRLYARMDIGYTLTFKVTCVYGVTINKSTKAFRSWNAF